MSDRTPHCGNCGLLWTRDEKGDWQAPCDCASAWTGNREVMREIDRLENQAEKALQEIIGIAKGLKTDVEKAVRENPPGAVPSRLGPHDPQRPGSRQRVVGRTRDGVQGD